MSLTGYNYYGNQNIENQNNQDGLIGITYNPSSDTTIIDNNVLITTPNTLTLNGYNVDLKIQSLENSNINTTGITYNSGTDTTQIDNNLTVTKDLIISSRNILNELDLINTVITDISFNSIGDETIISGNLNVTGSYLKVGSRIILDELDTLNYNNTNISYNGTDTTTIGNNLIVNSRNVLNELDTLNYNNTNISYNGTDTTTIGNNLIVNSRNVLNELNTINTTLTDITFNEAENRTTIWNNLFVFDMDIKNSIEQLQTNAISSLSYDASNNLTICNSNFKITGDLNMDLGVLYNSVSVICNYLQTKINFSYTDVDYDLGYTNLYNTYLQAGSYYIDFFQPNGSINYHLKDASNNSVFYKLDNDGLNLNKKNCKIGDLILNDLSNSNYVDLKYNSNDLNINCNYVNSTDLYFYFKNSSGTLKFQKLNAGGLDMNFTDIANVNTLTTTNLSISNQITFNDGTTQSSAKNNIYKYGNGGTTIISSYPVGAKWVEITCIGAGGGGSSGCFGDIVVGVQLRCNQGGASGGSGGISKCKIELDRTQPMTLYIGFAGLGGIPFYNTGAGDIGTDGGDTYIVYKGYIICKASGGKTPANPSLQNSEIGSPVGGVAGVGNYKNGVDGVRGGYMAHLTGYNGNNNQGIASSGSGGAWTKPQYNGGNTFSLGGNGGNFIVDTVFNNSYGGAIANNYAYANGTAGDEVLNLGTGGNSGACSGETITAKYQCNGKNGIYAGQSGSGGGSGLTNNGFTDCFLGGNGSNGLIILEYIF